MVKRVRGVGNPLVSLFSTGLFSHGDNTFYALPCVPFPSALLIVNFITTKPWLTFVRKFNVTETDYCEKGGIVTRLYFYFKRPSITRGERKHRQGEKQICASEKLSSSTSRSVTWHLHLTEVLYQTMVTWGRNLGRHGPRTRNNNVSWWWENIRYHTRKLKSSAEFWNKPTPWRVYQEPDMRPKPNQRPWKYITGNSIG